MKKITVPMSYGYPETKVWVNGVEYTVPTGVEVEVEDAVAKVIEASIDQYEEHMPVGGANGSDGGVSMGAKQPHIEIVLAVKNSGASIGFDNATANMTYDEVVAGVLAGKITHCTYAMRVLDMPPIEVGVSFMVGRDGNFENCTQIAFKIADYGELLSNDMFVWNYDNTIDVFEA